MRSGHWLAEGVVEDEGAPEGVYRSWSAIAAMARAIPCRTILLHEGRQRGQLLRSCRGMGGRRRNHSRVLAQQPLEQTRLDPLPKLGRDSLPKLKVLAKHSLSQLGSSELPDLSIIGRTNQRSVLVVATARVEKTTRLTPWFGDEAAASYKAGIHSALL
jgi:hypothetical protein